MADTNTGLREAVRAGSVPHLLHLVKETSFSQYELDGALHEAAWLGSLSGVRVLVAAGAKLHSLNSFGEPLMVEAVHSGDLALIEHLLQEGYKVDHGITDGGGVAAPLHLAINKGGGPIVEALLAAGACMEYRDVDGDTPLVAAANSGQLHTVHNLLKHGCIVNAGGYEANTALHRAVEQGNLEIISAILDHDNCDVNLCNEQGNTAFLLACSSGNDTVVKALAGKATLDISHTNKAGKNAMHMAATCGISDLIPPLLQLGTDCTVRDKSGNTPLVISTILGHECFGLDLLCEASDVNAPAIGKTGRNVLHWAAWNGLARLVKALLQVDNSLGNVGDGKGDTPFVLATRKQHMDLLEYFVVAGCDPNIPGENGRTVLSWVAVHGGPEAMDTMLGVPGIDVDKPDAMLNTPLLNAAVNRRYIEMRKLLSDGVSVNRIGGEGRSALHWVSLRGNAEITRLLLDHGAQTDVADSGGDCPLILASREGHEVVVNELLAAGVSPNSKDPTMMTALHYCASKGLMQSVKKLIKKGADLNARNQDNDTAALLAAEAAHEAVVRLLADVGCDVNITGKENRIALFFAAQKGLSEAVETLLSHGSLTENDCYSSPLIQASKRGYTQIASKLIARGAAAGFRDQHGRTAVIWAAQGGHVDTIKVLLEHGADPKWQDLSGDTALILAAWHGHSEAVSLLAPLSDLDHREKDEGMSALHLAVSGSHVQTAQVLLKAGASVNIQENKGNNVLLTAAIHSVGDGLLRLLLTCGQKVDVNYKGDDGRTAIHWAVGDPDCVAELLQRRPDVNCVDDNGASPLLLAVAHGQPRSARMLIDAGCDVNAIHQDGRCPIHHAVLYGDLTTVKLLLSKGVDANATTADGRTPLLLAAMEGHCPIVEVLLAKSICRINEVFFDAITALSAAAASGHYAVMQRLLEYGADPDLVGSRKTSALVSCIYQDDVRGTVILLQGGAKLDQGKDTKQHPLQVAAIKNNAFMLQLLSAIDCDVNYLQRLLAEGAIYYFVQNDELLKSLETRSRVPKTMQALCRRTIRGLLGLPIANKIQWLPVPSMLKDYLALKELNILLPDDDNDDEIKKTGS